MNLDPNIAKEIVDNLKDVINLDINLFNTSGEIIASTNRLRVGELHYGAIIAADSKRSLEVTYDEQFKGSKKGLNIPIIFNDTVAAVIGITGDKDIVSPYGNIIKKMTEILLRENFSQLVSFNAQNHYRDLSSALLTKFPDEGLINYLSEILEININVQRRVVIASLTNCSIDYDHTLDTNPLAQFLRLSLSKRQNSFYWIKDRDIILFLDINDNHEAYQFIEEISKSLNSNTNFEFNFGSSSLHDNYQTYWLAFEEAEIALRWNQFVKTLENNQLNKKNITFYEEINEGLFFTNLGLEHTKEYISQIFKDLSDKEINDFIEIFDVYVQVNGSITKGAEKLFIHKNTFQNKLNLIYERTGYNPRNLKDFSLLWLAFTSYKWLQFNTFKEI